MFRYLHLLKNRRLRTWDAYLGFLKSLDIDKIQSRAPLQKLDRDLKGAELSRTSEDKIVGDPGDFKDLYEAYGLEKLISADGAFATALNAMAWLTENTYYSGAATYNRGDDTEKILDYSFGKPFRYAINCRHKAIALTDILCACGVNAYPVMLHSAAGGHFVCHVRSDELKKRGVVDPSFNTWFSADSDTPLDVFELRDIFLSGKEPVIHGYDFDHTDECRDIYINLFLRATLSNISTWSDCKSERRRSVSRYKKTDFSAALPTE